MSLLRVVFGVLRRWFSADKRGSRTGSKGASRAGLKAGPLRTMGAQEVADEQEAWRKSLEEGRPRVSQEGIELT